MPPSAEHSRSYHHPVQGGTKTNSLLNIGIRNYSIPTVILGDQGSHQLFAPINRG